ncbi:glycogenin glucosyltransferase [Cystobasidiomycetes sp. EMM_F5]
MRMDVGASDYASLVNKWFSVYHRYFAAGNANQSTFTFPKLQAIWNQDGKSGAVPYRYVPPSMEELKRSFQGQGASSSSFISGKGTSQQQSIEGHYVSMPIQAGIPDLSKPVIFTSPSSPPRSPSPTVTITAPTPPIGPSAQPHFENPQIHVRSPSPQAAPAVPQHTAPARAWSPPNVAWDPARSEPPKNDKPQMSVAWDNQYQNTWDAPRSPASKKFFVAPEKYAPMPAVTHQDYSRHTQQSVPSSSQGQASQTPSNFPWESQQRAPPTRVFPGEPKPKPIVQTIPMPSRNSAAQGPMTPSLNPGSGSAAFSGQYTNAWDNVAGIQRYATHLKERNSPRPRSYRQASYTNSQTPANSSHQAQAASSSSTQQYSSPHNNSHLAPNSSHSHSRNASTGSFYGQERQYGGRGGNSVTRNGNGSTQQQTSPRKNENNASSSGYETGGEASSRDGDDEDEADDEDDGPLDSRSHPSRSRNNTSASGPSQPTSSARYAPLRGNSSENTTQVNSNTSPPSVLSTSLPPATSNGTYQSQSVSRVFDQRTDPDVIRKEGLGALQRFVRNMEARGAAQENGASSPVNGSKPSSRQHSPTIAR